MRWPFSTLHVRGLLMIFQAFSGYCRVLRVSLSQARAGRRRHATTPASVERLERRALLSAINGTVFADRDADGVRDAAEPPLAGRTVYIDADNDGRLGAGEATAITDASGSYAFSELVAGTYLVRQVLPDGWRRSFPAAGSTVGVLISFTGGRDLVLDDGRGLLYVTTDRGVVERIDLATGNRLAGVTVGTSLYGADITPDGGALYVAEGQTAGGQGFVRKIDLTSGSVSSLAYGLAFGEAGAYDVTIGTDGKGLVTTQYAGSGWIPLRDLDTVTDTLTARAGEHHEVRQNTQIHRSDDRSSFFLTESNSSNGPVFTYDVATNSFPRSAELWTSLSSMRSAMNRDGSLIAMEIDHVSIMDREYRAVENLSGITGGFAFDPTKDVFYGIDASDASNDWVVAFDTHSWDELYCFRIGENMTLGGAFGSGTIRVTADGRFLVLATPSGVRLFDLVAASGGRTAVVTPTAGALGVTFGSFAEPLPEVRISDATILEGNTGTRSVVLTVTLSEPTYTTIRVTYATTDGSATTAGGDYAIASGAMEFAPGETSKTLTVFVRGDTRDELDEQFFVNLMGAEGGSIADGQAVVRINNDDIEARGSIGGMLWDDLDGDGIRDAGEVPLVGWTTYIDANNNGRLDSGERTTVTGSDGRYAFSGLPAGEYTVAQVLPDGWVQTSNRGLSGVAGHTFSLPLGTVSNPLYQARDFVYDAARNQLLITTAAGTVERLDLNEMRLLDPFQVGNVLLGADITLEGGSLYVAESIRNITQGFVRKVNLADGSVTDLAYDLVSPETGAFDVAITSSGLALVTTRFDGSGWNPLRNLDTGTDTFSIRSDLPDGVRQDSMLYRSADRGWVLLLEGNISSGPVHVYDAAANTFPADIETVSYVTDYPAAVSRDGSLIALGYRTIFGDEGLWIYDRNLRPLPGPTVTGRTTGLAFDPTRDVLYRAGTTEIIAYETDGFTELFRFPIGETLDRVNGPMTVSADGRQLFLFTNTGLRVFQLIADAQRITLAAGQSITNTDFLNFTERIVATDDVFSVTEGHTVSGNLLANDSGPDGDPLTIVAVNGYATAVGQRFIQPAGGVLVVYADGTFVYETGRSFEGLAVGSTQAVTFTYSVSNGQQETVTATVTVTVIGENDAPVTIADDVWLESDSTATGDLLSNDSDPEGDALTVTAINGEPVAFGQAVTLVSGATVTVNADGSFLYDPNGAFDGLQTGETTTDTFTYTVGDGQGGATTELATATIRAREPDPIAEADAVVTGPRGIAAGNVLANDWDPEGDWLTVSAVNGDAASVGRALTLASGAIVTVNTFGDFLYDPNGAFDGLARDRTATDSFSYSISDGQGGEATAQVTITVLGSARYFSVEDAEIGRGDQTVRQVKVRLNEPLPEGVTATVTYATADGTATTGGDYVFQTGTLTFSGGTTVQTIQIETKPSGLPRGDEFFFIRLSEATNAGILKPATRITIVDPWEAETSALGHVIGRADSDGWSASTVLDSPGFLLYGPYVAGISQGLQVARFRMLVDNNSFDNAKVARIEVFEARTGTVLAQRVLTRRDFETPSEYQNFDLAFENPSIRSLEFRVWWYDTSYVKVDHVRVLPAPVQALVLEAEQHLHHQVGRSQSGGWTANTALDGAGYLAFGPYTPAVPAGRQSATFRLLVDNNTANNAPVVTIDVHDASTGRVLAQRVVRRADFVAANAFQEFALAFENAFGSRLEFRTFWHDTALVTLDRVIVTQTPTPPPLKFEAEAAGVFGHQIGRRREDGWSANVVDDSPGYLAYGPYTTAAAAGSHVALFRLLVDNHTANNAQIVTLDVVDAGRGQVLAARTLTRQEFSSAYTYQFFALPFTSASGAQLEFRAWWHGTSFVQMDSVVVIDAPSPQRLIETEGLLVGHSTGRATAGGWSANVAQDTAGWLAVGPYDQSVLPAGTYTAGFRLLVDNHRANNDPIVTLDVFDRTSGQILARRTLTRFEFQAANAFQEFGLTFTSAPEARLEYRTFWHDRAYVEQDSVRVLPATWTADELEPVFDEIEDLLLTA